jgi:hypothetical protein
MADWAGARTAAEAVSEAMEAAKNAFVVLTKDKTGSKTTGRAAIWRSNSSTQLLLVPIAQASTGVNRDADGSDHCQGQKKGHLNNSNADGPPHNDWSC